MTNESEKQKDEIASPFLILPKGGRVQLYGLIANLTPEEARDLHKTLGAAIGLAEVRGSKILRPDLTRFGR